MDGYRFDKELAEDYYYNEDSEPLDLDDLFDYIMNNDIRKISEILNPMESV